jgi:hypothetical protein
MTMVLDVHDELQRKQCPFESPISTRLMNCRFQCKRAERQQPHYEFCSWRSFCNSRTAMGLLCVVPFIDRSMRRPLHSCGRMALLNPVRGYGLRFIRVRKLEHISSLALGTPSQQRRYLRTYSLSAFAR